MKVHLLTAAVLFSAVSLKAQTAPECPPPITHIDVVAGSFATQPGATFRLKGFSAVLVPKGKTAPQCYAKVTVIHRGEIVADDASLDTVFTTKLARGKSKIKNFTVVNEPQKVTVSGTLKKIIPVKFTIEGTLSTDGTSIALHATSFKADGVPVKGLLGIFGKDLSSVVKVKGVQGISVQHDTISFKPELLANLKGRIVAVSNIEGALVLRYGAGEADKQPHASLVDATPEPVAKVPVAK
jgi:hypothetical protein